MVYFTIYRGRQREPLLTPYLDWWELDWPSWKVANIATFSQPGLYQADGRSTKSQKGIER
jgi:hypothetical protein